MTGADAKAAFDQASALVKLNRYAEALAVELYPSDRRVIEAKIAAAKQAPSAKGTKV